MFQFWQNRFFGDVNRKRRVAVGTLQTRVTRHRINDYFQTESAVKFHFFRRIVRVNRRLVKIHFIALSDSKVFAASPLY